MTLISSPIGSAFTIVTFKGTALELKKEHDYKYNMLSIKMIILKENKMKLLNAGEVMVRSYIYTLKSKIVPHS